MGACDFLGHLSVLDLETGEDIGLWSGSFGYLYSFPSWFPSISSNSLRRFWDVHESNLVKIDEVKDTITYYIGERESKSVYSFPLPAIPCHQKESLEIIVGGSRMFIVRSDKATVLISARNAF